MRFLLRIVNNFTMSSRTKFLTFLLSTFAFYSLSVEAIAQTKLTNQSKVYINGIGSVRVGMTVAEASKAAGTKLIQASSGGEEHGCFYFHPQREPKGVDFMVLNGRIARVDVAENKSITTLSGAKIGDTEAKIKSLYPGQIQVTPHEYVQGGHYLTLVPKDRADKNYRIVFETDGKRVTTFRSGKRPEVEYIEGCV